MRYKAGKTEVVNPGIESKEWEKAPEGKITHQRWKEFYQPINTTFKVLRGPEGISVLMHTDEKNLLCERAEENSDVCCDSCMEFFFKPNPWDPRYINFELNPNGVMNSSVGNGRHGRIYNTEDRSIFSIESDAKDGDWTLKFYIPDAFLIEKVGKIASVCKGNFYKCGEDTDHSHFITWCEVEVDKPDYHIPDFFGFIEL